MGVILFYLIGQLLYLIRKKYTTTYRQQQQYQYNMDSKHSTSSSSSGSLATRISNSGPISIAAYCLSSILMTVTNKYVLSGFSFNLNFFLLAVQSIVCIVTIFWF